jgi:chemotaxis protein methyltransferase CheR
LDRADFDFVAALVKRRSGVEVSCDKDYFLVNRLAPLARKEGLGAVGDIVEVLRSRRDERLAAAVVDALIPGETAFFRDRTPFLHLKEAVLPELAAARRGERIRIWCAGCSTGQEPYSIAMMLDQSPLMTAGCAVEIVAGDISERAIERARSGLYTQFEVQLGLPVRMLLQYFTQEGEDWRISERIRSMVTFRRLNLAEPFVNLGRFDIVLCRNVLTSFDAPTRADVLARIAAQMPADGALFLGAAETSLGLSDQFEPSRERRGLYRPAGGAAPRAA